ncbi:hypothetical protein E2562_026102 [Oryza meyeriana var. granulata]|uniref:RING-type domain-containing protein n=1 Tax=Oryza meyeriana var. granulata TaxID=110450 RepID=A0A6G1C0U1_9ORYZ|nr:hypothetical protein E2562_026102 [Oryza meyeriana var. granulata]
MASRSNDVDGGVPWYSNCRFGSIPASGEAIAVLEETSAGEVREKGCSVCLEVFEESDKPRKMPCFAAHRGGGAGAGSCQLIGDVCFGHIYDELLDEDEHLIRFRRRASFIHM